MKKVMVIIALALLLAGCGQAGMQSEFWQHDSVYKNWDHMKFSWFGHNHPTAEDRQNAASQGWWGLDVPYVPGQ